MESETLQPTVTRSMHNTSQVRVTRVPACFTPAEAARFLSILNEGFVIGALSFKFLGFLQVDVPALYGREFQDLQSKWMLADFDEPSNTAAFELTNDEQQYEFNVVIPRNAPTGTCNYGFVAMATMISPEALGAPVFDAEQEIAEAPVVPDVEDSRTQLIAWAQDAKVREFLTKVGGTVVPVETDHGWKASIQFTKDSQLAQLFGAWDGDTQDIYNSILELRPTDDGWKTTTAWRLMPASEAEANVTLTTNVEEGAYVFFKEGDRPRIIMVEPGPLFKIDEQYIVKRLHASA